MERISPGTGLETPGAMVLVWMIPSQSRAADGQREKAKVEMLPYLSHVLFSFQGFKTNTQACGQIFSLPHFLTLTGTQTVCYLSKVGTFEVDHFTGWCFLLYTPVDPHSVRQAVNRTGKQDFWLELNQSEANVRSCFQEMQQVIML